MKKSMGLLGCVLGLASLAAHADGIFAGTWKGTGQLDSSLGVTTCDAATISIEQSATSFDFTLRKFLCDELVHQWSPLSFGVNARGQILREGKVVGALDGASLSAKWKEHETDEEGNPTEPTYWELSTTVSRGKLHYVMTQTYDGWISIVTADLAQ